MGMTDTGTLIYYETNRRKFCCLLFQHLRQYSFMPTIIEYESKDLIGCYLEIIKKDKININNPFFDCNNNKANAIKQQSYVTET